MNHDDHDVSWIIMLHLYYQNICILTYKLEFSCILDIMSYKF